MPVGLEAGRARPRELLALAARFAEGARRALGPITAWVYGSVARGDFNLWSDVDVLVVAEELPHRPQDRFGMLLEVAPAKVEPKGYTVAEFRGLLARLDPQLLGALRRRVLLADDLGLEGELEGALRRRGEGGGPVAGPGSAR